MDYLAEAVADPTSALLVSGERALAAEFPADSQARLVLGAIGAGERNFSLIARAAGLPQASLHRALNRLVAKRLVEAATPVFHASLTRDAVHRCCTCGSGCRFSVRTCPRSNAGAAA